MDLKCLYLYAENFKVLRDWLKMFVFICRNGVKIVACTPVIVRELAHIFEISKPSSSFNKVSDLCLV